MFTATHDAFWAAARTAGGDTAGTRALIEVLLLHRKLPAAAVIAGMKAALTVGAVTADVVAVEARRAATTLQQPEPTGGEPATGSGVLTLPDRAGAPADLPADDRPVPSVTAYDELLRRRTPHPDRRSDLMPTTTTTTTESAGRAVPPGARAPPDLPAARAPDRDGLADRDRCGLPGPAPANDPRPRRRASVDRRVR